MATKSAGTVLITGPTGGLGRSTTLAMAHRSGEQRPDLILVGRGGAGLSDVAAQARAAGSTVVEILCDLANLADVRNAVEAAEKAVVAGTVGPLRAVIANAGVSVKDTEVASADGYELTFAVNYLAHAALIRGLLDMIDSPGRVVLLGSNTYSQNWPRKVLHVPPAHWRDPLDLARPGGSAGGVAYSDSKLALLYYGHELQRHAPQGVNVIVFEPGFMPGTGLSRAFGPAAQRIGRVIERIPGVSSPARSGPLLASLALDPRWADLRDGAFVVKTEPREVKTFAHDRAREARLWEATSELLDQIRGDAR